MSWTRLAGLKEIKDDACNIFENTYGKILLVKLSGSDQLYALSGVCPHEDYVLEDGFVQEGTIICPLHLSAFSLETGEVQNPPAEQSLESFAVKVENGSVFIKKKKN